VIGDRSIPVRVPVAMVAASLCAFGCAAAPPPLPPATGPVRASGLLRFLVEPPDAVIAISGVAPHRGAPFDVRLAPGEIQIAVRRPGYRTYVTAVQLGAGETQTLRIGLSRP
jgi:PEGA domain